MKVRFLKMHPAYAYFTGDECHMEDARAKTLLNGKYVEVVIEKQSQDNEKKGEQVKLTSAEQPSIKKSSRKRR